jgi:acyl-CoA reductase-like NAD-dependent aldehyde dehydrogenase
MVEKYQLFIDGRWKDSASGEAFETFNPFNQEVWATIPSATEDDVKAAIAAARGAFEKTWRHTNGLERAGLINRLAALLEENADRFALLETTDNGKVIRETRSQMFFAARVFRFFAGYADKIWGSVIPLDQRDIFDFAMREPYGVVGIITAWNSPTRQQASGSAGRGKLRGHQALRARLRDHARVLQARGEGGIPGRRRQRGHR